MVKFKRIGSLGMKVQPYIYKVTNLINNRVYVGQHTGSNPNYYCSGEMVRKAIKKYGKSNFKREILIQGDFTQDQLDKLERDYIESERSYFFSNPERGYNLTTGGQGVRDFVPSEDYKELQSINSKKNIPVLQFTLNGEFIAEYRSIKAAYKATGVLHSGIYRACTKEVPQANQFLWVFKKDYDGTPPSLRDSASKSKVALYNLNGNLLNKFNSITEASKATRVNRSAIHNCVCGISKSAGGFQWRTYEVKPLKTIPPMKKHNIEAGIEKRMKPVDMFDLNNNLIRTFPSALDVEKELGFTKSGITQCCLGRYTTSKGYIWRFSKHQV